MNLAMLLEQHGEGTVLAVGGLVIGLLFGFLAQRSRFCLRAAVLEFWGRSFGEKLSVWLFLAGPKGRKRGTLRALGFPHQHRHAGRDDGAAHPVAQAEGRAIHQPQPEQSHRHIHRSIGGVHAP